MRQAENSGALYWRELTTQPMNSTDQALPFNTCIVIVL